MRPNVSPDGAQERGNNRAAISTPETARERAWILRPADWPTVRFTESARRPAIDDRERVFPVIGSSAGLEASAPSEGTGSPTRGLCLSCLLLPGVAVTLRLAAVIPGHLGRPPPGSKERRGSAPASLALLPGVAVVLGSDAIVPGHRCNLLWVKARRGVLSGGPPDGTPVRPTSRSSSPPVPGLASSSARSRGAFVMANLNLDK